MIALLKALHIAALAIWCAGLILLPIVLRVYGARREMATQAGFAEFRWLTHYSYTRVLSPAAVVAVVAGTALIFALEVFDAWLMAKLAVVTGMVLVHVWLGHLIVQAGERRAPFRLSTAAAALVAVVPLIGLVLWLVLAKPDLQPLLALLPEVLTEPRGNAIPARLNPL